MGRFATNFGTSIVAMPGVEATLGRPEELVRRDSARDLRDLVISADSIIITPIQTDSHRFNYYSMSQLLVTSTS